MKLTLKKKPRELPTFSDLDTVTLTCLLVEAHLAAVDKKPDAVTYPTLAQYGDVKVVAEAVLQKKRDVKHRLVKATSRHLI